MRISVFCQISSIKKDLVGKHVLEMKFWVLYLLARFLISFRFHVCLSSSDVTVPFLDDLLCFKQQFWWFLFFKNVIHFLPMVMHFPWNELWSFCQFQRFWSKMNPYFPCRWPRLLHVLVLNLPISLLVLISQRAMSGQVNVYHFCLKCMLPDLLQNRLLNLI